MTETSWQTIRLPGGEWEYDDAAPLGAPGGFGAVFVGRGPDHPEVAVKKLNLEAEAVAHRELRIAAELMNRELKHVIPFLDAGQDAESNSYFLVMLRAERSLQDEIDPRGALPETDTAEVLKQIAMGLSEVADLVHRDLKPANVLWHDGMWKVADFGIARFVEESTSLQTLQGCLTPEYAAPEQWRLERGTAATDIYALGCIAYTLLTGAPPFQGDGLREEHLHETPAPVSGCSPKMRQLISMMLRKVPDARPSRSRVLTILDQIISAVDQQSGEGLKELAIAGAEVERQRAEREAEEARTRAVQDARAQLANEGKAILKDIFEDLCESVVQSVPNAYKRQEGNSSFICIEGSGIELNLRSEAPIPKDAFPQARWDVVTGAIIQVKQAAPTYEWTASLWYTDRGHQSGYRWYEVAYQTGAFSSRRAAYEPFALNPEEADRAAGPAMHIVNVAYGPFAIDDEDVDAFCDRWARLLAAACKGELRYPPNYSLIN